MQGKHLTRRIRILVKAFPQPSKKHEETVCCAGITEDTLEFLRLFPIRYRRLPKEDRFKRYDLVEMMITKDSDHRPESYRVDEESIRLIQRGGLSDENKVGLWRPFIASSIGTLIEENKISRRSLGIIRPDPDSLRFAIKAVNESSEEDREVAELVYQQASLLEDPLKPLAKPAYGFYYQFTCANPTICTCKKNPHTHQIHDWEVQAAYLNYKRRYKTEEKTLEMVTQEYQQNIPARNLHFVMGTMKAHPQTFIIIGLLRSGVDPEDIGRQGKLF